MSDYTKSVDFAAKDALITGNPAKVVKGTEIDTEFNNIATAIATKYDSTDLGVTLQAYDADLVTWAGVTPGAGVATALAVAIGSAGAPIVNGGVLGTPSSGTLTNCTSLPAAGVSGTALVSAAIGTTVQAYDADIPTTAASQVEMETGTEAALRSMSPLRVAQAVAALSVGKVVQMVKSVTGAVSTTTGTIPQDDTIPQNTEGGEFMTLAITPTSASNRLLIMHIGMYTSNTGFAATGVCVALFQDSTANALSATNVTGGSNSVPQSCSLTHEMAAGTTSATTFKIRAGCGTAATTTFNGSAGARLYGGVASSSLVIMEIEP